MLDDQAMAESWFIRVDGKEYGPAELETLRAWKIDSRVLPTNEARSAESDKWVTAAEIPGLFETENVATGLPATRDLAQAPIQQPRSFGQIIGEIFRIYGRGFFQFLYLTLLVLLPSICAQLSGSGFNSSSTNLELNSAAAALFTVCMTGLSLAAWPVFIIGIQILTAEFMAGRRPNVFGIFGDILKFWPRVAMLCILVYGIFLLLSVFAVGIAAMIIIGASSPFLILIALVLLSVQVWLFGRFYINVLFWQQFAVLGDSDVASALRRSKELARSGRNLAWYQRPMWRGVFISSLWCAFVLAMILGPEWPMIRQYYHEMMTTTDPEALLKTLRAGSTPHGFNVVAFALGLVQTILRPLLGIAFVVLYFDATRQKKYLP